jgi:hypothetical protein
MKITRNIFFAVVKQSLHKFPFNKSENNKNNIGKLATKNRPRGKLYDAVDIREGRKAIILANPANIINKLFFEISKVSFLIISADKPTMRVIASNDKLKIDIER